MSRSYPLLGLARQYDLPYGVLLQFAEHVMEGGQPHMVLRRWHAAVTEIGRRGLDFQLRMRLSELHERGYIHHPKLEDRP